MKSLLWGFLAALSLVVVGRGLVGVAAQTGGAAGAEAWKAGVYGDDWQEEAGRIQQVAPELLAGAGLPATASDEEAIASMPVELKAEIDQAVRDYYVRLDAVTSGYAGRKFLVRAAREVEGYFLLWIDEPEIMDGGRAIIYSRAKNRIVGEFWDGGIRG